MQQYELNAILYSRTTASMRCINDRSRGDLVDLER
jgi:hypothetical protein